MICRLTPQLVKVEYHRGQPGVNIAGAKPGSELGESLFGIGAGRISRSAKARARRTMLLLADAKIRSDQDVERAGGEDGGGQRFLPRFSRFFGLKASLILGDLRGLTTKVVPAGHRPEQPPGQGAAGTTGDSGRLWTISSHMLRLWSDHETRPGKPRPEGPRVGVSASCRGSADSSGRRPA